MLFVSLASLEWPLDLTGVDGFELRLDLLAHLDLEAIGGWLKKSPLPVMLTLRKQSHGGKFEGSEELREFWIEALLGLEPPFFDLEYDMRDELLKDVLKKYPKTQYILSCHSQCSTHWEALFDSMKKYRVFGYKMALAPRSSSEALRMLLFGKDKEQLSLICVGEMGSFARTLGPVVGNQIDYTVLEEGKKTAPGQLALQEFLRVYRYRSLNPKTAIYGLIGDPVAKSRGALYHNAFFQKNKINAIYVKMNVKADELASFFSLAQQLGFKGLSVTMPLKEKVIPFLDAIEERAQQIGAVNTMVFKNNKILGANTDGIGALDAIEKRGPVRGKQVVILGAGGSARAIAWEAKWRGAELWIANRTVERAQLLASAVGGEAGDLTDLPSRYDILINCTPDPGSVRILPQTLVMDAVYVPKKTPFLQEAARLGCSCIDGEEMFEGQAAAQTAFWFPS
jgi:3-dehydroquinate dehydratase/shikimate dehydrogenase